MALAVLLVAIFCGKFIQFCSSLGKPISQDYLTKKEYTWNSQSSINLAIEGSTVSVLNYNPGNQTAVILNIPSDTYFDLPRGFGEWNVASIYSLGQEEKPPVGAELLRESIAKLLGLPVDDYLLLPESDKNLSMDQVISSWHKNPLSIISFIKSSQTDLTPLEAFSLFRSLSGVRSDKFTDLDISQSDITKSELLPDSSRVLGINSVNLDLFVRKYMSDPKIVDEEVNIGIFNGTNHPGLGQEASRIITNMGGNVIFVSNTDQTFSKSEVVYSQDSLTARRLMEVFAPWCLNNCVSTDPMVQNSRAAVNVILGEDFFKSQ